MKYRALDEQKAVFLEVDDGVKGLVLRWIEVVTLSIEVVEHFCLLGMEMLCLRRLARIEDDEGKAVKFTNSKCAVFSDGGENAVNEVTINFYVAFIILLLHLF